MSEDMQKDIRVAVHEALEANLGRIGTAMANLGTQVEKRCARMEHSLDHILDKLNAVCTVKQSEARST